MGTLIQLLPLLIVVFVIVSIVRNVAKAVRKVGEQTQPPPHRPAGDYDPDLAQRTRRIQEEIRRKIAERRGTVVAPEPFPTEARMEPPIISADERVERQYTASDAAVLERQQQLADQMRALEQARALEQRRAAQVTATLTTEAQSERGLLIGTRGSLLAELRDPAGLRRAFVLREVLGTPVGLR